MYRFTFNWYFVRKSAPIWNFILLKSIQSSDYYITKVDPVVYKNTILLCLGVMLGIFIILLVWMDGRNLSSLMMKEEIKEKRPVSSKWMLLTVLGIVFIILAIKQYKPGTWGYYFAHIYFLIGGILLLLSVVHLFLNRRKKDLLLSVCIENQST